MSTPASIRYNNPGAQYPGPSATRFGALGHEIIGGGHKIAVFPDAESGAAAQFDLLSRRYAGMPIRDAIAKWSGGNASDAYANHILKQTGLSPDAVLSPEMLRDPRAAIPLVRAMAQWEAGRAYPLDEAGWNAAHSRAFGAGQANRVTEAQTQPAAQPAASASNSNADATMPGSWAPIVAAATESPPTEQPNSEKLMSLLAQLDERRQAAADEAGEQDMSAIGRAPGAAAPDLRRVLAVLKNRQRLGSHGKIA